MPVPVRDGREIGTVKLVAFDLGFNIGVHEGIVHVAVLSAIEKSEGRTRKYTGPAGIEYKSDFPLPRVAFIQIAVFKPPGTYEELYVNVNGICLYGEDCHEDCKDCIKEHFMKEDK